MSEFGRLEAMAAGEEWQRRRKPFEPVPVLYGRGPLSKLCRASARKRQFHVSPMVSQEALNALIAEGAKVDGSAGTISGLVLDYLARHGRIEAVLKEAIAELEGQS